MQPETEIALQMGTGVETRTGTMALDRGATRPRHGAAPSGRSDAPKSGPAPRRRWPAAVGAAILLAALAGGCGWKRCAYSGFGRDDWQQPERVVETLAIEPGASVADLGAGGGYFTWRLAGAVGEEGHVYAVDVDEGMLEYIREYAADNGHSNVTTVRATFDDPRLPEPVDLVFCANTYHHLEDRVTYFRDAARHIAPGGRLAIVELAPDASWFTRWFGHHTSAETIREELEQAGYVLIEQPTFLERQSFLVFSRPAG